MSVCRVLCMFRVAFEWPGPCKASIDRQGRLESPQASKQASLSQQTKEAPESLATYNCGLTGQAKVHSIAQGQAATFPATYSWCAFGGAKRVSATMAVHEDEIFQTRPPQRQAPWHKALPLLYAPVRCRRCAAAAAAAQVAATVPVRSSAAPSFSSKLAPLSPLQLLYTLRFALKGRVEPATQHRIFIGATVAALAHAGFVMTADSSM